jgi:hypothetical protein
VGGGGEGERTCRPTNTQLGARKARASCVGREGGSQANKQSNKRANKHTDKAKTHAERQPS